MRASTIWTRMLGLVLAFAVTGLLGRVSPVAAATTDESTVPAAGPAQEEGMSADQFEQTLNYRDGEVVLKEGLATLKLPSQFRYLDPKDTERVLTQAWGNPEGSGTLGMIVPRATGVTGDEAWAVIVTFQEDGYVSDKDADSINYDELLEDMKQASKASSDERVKQGYQAIDLVGWAEPPRYDAAQRKMYWAQDFRVGDAQMHTLNYNIRVLGRRGVLVLTAVSTMDQLALIKEQTPAILAATDFNPGHTYADFNADTDKVATYGLAALVAGGLAAKTGLLAKLVALAVAGKKIIFVVLLGFGALLRRVFAGKPKAPPQA